MQPTLTMMALGLLDLRFSWRIHLILALLVAVTTMSYVSIDAYLAGLRLAFPGFDSSALVVQQSHTTGEIAGSRIPAAVEDQLHDLGFETVVPEIHSLVGTSAQDATLLRGVDPARYRLALPFELLSGAALETTTPARQALLGWRLAQKRGLEAGATVRLRGRAFGVLGVFRTGTYADNEAWVSIPDAQALLGWGDEVSIFILPNNGLLSPGMVLPGGLSVIRRGEGIQNDLRHSLTLFNLIADILKLVGFATAMALSTVLLRLAWLRRQHVAILRSIGFTRAGQSAYLLAQSAAISLGGALLGWLASLALTRSLPAASLGLDVQPYYSAATLLAGLAWTGAIALFGMLLPALWLSRFDLAPLLRRE